MAFPKNITKEHLLKAIEKIDTDGIPSDGNSKYYIMYYVLCIILYIMYYILCIIYYILLIRIL